LVAHITNNRFYFSSVVSDVVDQVMSSAILWIKNTKSDVKV
jgi:acid phosphatase family membrane protein YuiD